jgi:hypothetical protein
VPVAALHISSSFHKLLCKKKTINWHCLARLDCFLLSKYFSCSVIVALLHAAAAVASTKTYDNSLGDKSGKIELLALVVVIWLPRCIMFILICLSFARKSVRTAVISIYLWYLAFLDLSRISSFLWIRKCIAQSFLPSIQSWNQICMMFNLARVSYTCPFHACFH